MEEAIFSVLEQSHPAVEIIVVDDGSTDDSLTIVERLQAQHPERIQLLTQPQSGPYPARNHGLREARGKFIAFLDADDWWDHHFLEKLLRALQNSHADLAYCGWQNVGRHANTKPYLPPTYEEQEDMVRSFLHGCPWPIHAALVKRSVVDAVQGFSERRFSAMDYDFWIRILAHTRNMVRVPEVLAFYRWHGNGQISATRWKQVLDAVQVRRDFVANHPEAVAHIPSTELEQLVEGSVLKEAYRAYWNRDLGNAQKLFRIALGRHIGSSKDLRYLLPALLPAPLFRGLVELTDRRREG